MPKDENLSLKQSAKNNTDASTGSVSTSQSPCGRQQQGHWNCQPELEQRGAGFAGEGVTDSPGAVPRHSWSRWEVGQAGRSSQRRGMETSRSEGYVSKPKKKMLH